MSNAIARDLSRNTLFGNERGLADRLPLTSRQKLNRLRSETADARALTNQPYERMKELNDKAREVDARIRRLEAESVGPEARAEHNKIIELEREAEERFRSEARVEEEETARRRARSDAFSHVLRNVEQYVAALPPGAPLELAAPVVFTPAKGETATQAVERLRAKIEKLNDDKFDVENAPYPSSEAKARNRAKIETLADRGRPNVPVSLETKRPFSFAMKSGETVLAGRNESGATFTNLRDQFDAEAAFCWLHKDALITKVEAEIDAVADDANALTDSERAERLAQIAADMLAIERQEEAAIVAAAEMGVVILRRADADPRAILGLSDAAPAPME